MGDGYARAGDREGGWEEEKCEEDRPDEKEREERWYDKSSREKCSYSRIGKRVRRNNSV